MAIIEESWLPIAQTLGFKTELEMLVSLYTEEFMSIKDIAKVIGFAPGAVRRRLLINGIKTRPRGGPNRLGMRRLQVLSDDELFGQPYKQIVEKYNVHHTTVFAERRYRRGTNYQDKEIEHAVLSNQSSTMAE